MVVVMEVGGGGVDVFTIDDNVVAVAACVAVAVETFVRIIACRVFRPLHLGPMFFCRDARCL